MSRNVITIGIIAVCLVLATVESAFPAPVRSPVSPRAISLASTLTATRTGALQSAQITTELTSLCDLDGQMYGAGSGRIVAIGEDGKFSRTISIPITNPSISRYSSGVLVIGDCGKGVVYKFDVKSGQPTKQFALSEVRVSNSLRFAIRVSRIRLPAWHRTASSSSSRRARGFPARSSRSTRDEAGGGPLLGRGR